MGRVQLVASFVAAAMLLPSVARAAEGRVLDVSEAIDIALGGNVDLERASNAVAAGEVSVSMKKTVFLPVVQATMGPSMQLGKQFDQVSREYKGVLGGSLSVGLHLDIMLFDGLSGVAMLRSAKKDLKATRHDLTRTQQDVIYETVVAFAALLVAQELIRVDEENVLAQEQILELVKAQREAGHALQADVLKQQAELESARLTLLDAESDLAMDRLELERILGLEAGSISGVKPLDATGELPELDADEAVEAALAERPDLVALTERIGAAEEQVKAACSGYMPRISLFAQAGTSWSSMMDRYYSFPEQMFENNLNAVFGLSVVIPIFDGLVTKYEVDAARVEVASRKIDLEGAEQQVEIEVRQAFEDLEKATKQLEVATAQLGYASESLAAYEEMYALGGCTLVDVSESKALETKAAYDMVEARYGLLLGALAIEHAIGDSDAMIGMLSG